MILKIFIDTDGCAYTPSLLNRMMMTIILMTKNGAYRPILLNRVKDVNSRHCSSVATPNRHYLTSLDCLKSKTPPWSSERPHLPPSHQLGIKHLSRGEVSSRPTSSH